MHFRARCAAAAVAAALLVSAGPALAQGKPSPTDAAAAAITTADFAHHLGVLSDDSMAGRQTGTPGNEAAARYLVKQFKRLGLKPLGGKDFTQRYTLRFSTMDVAGTHLTITTTAGADTFAYGKDFILLPADRPSLAGELVFLGQAPLVAGHQPQTLKGKVAVYYLPGPISPEVNRRVAQANKEVAEVGAVALLFVVDSAVTDAFFTRFRGYAEREHSDLGHVPQVALAYRAAARLMTELGQDPTALTRAPAGSPPFETGYKMELAQPLKVRELNPPNVVGVLQGKDKALRDEYVVVSAHFDHVGIGHPDARGDSIYNGADDNASGTVALLEIAQAFRKGARPARSVIFLAVSGEEQGLRGSAAWVAKPPVPLAQIVADINLDMVTRNAPETVALLGQELSSVGATVRATAQAHPELKLTIPPGNPWPNIDLIYMSDQLSFLQARVPSVFFFTGMHEQLHQPSDELVRCDVDKGTRIARLAFLSTYALAAAPARPEWTEEGKRATFRGE